MKKIFVIILTVTFVAIAITFFLVRESGVNNIKGDQNTISCGVYEKREIVLNNKTIIVDVSDTDCKRELGLSGIDDFAGMDGMLFIFDEAGNYGFWMKNMNFSIDILWFNEEFEVVWIEKSISPETFPNIFGSKYISQYILELPANFSVENDIKVGDKIIFSKKDY
jgi:hypothetical protein